MFNTVLLLLGLAIFFGIILLLANHFWKKDEDTLVLQIDACLPQTQCGQCQFPGCKPYAKAIASGQADINRCPPGGQKTIDQLALLLGKNPVSLDKDYGEYTPPQIAVIDEAICIGCTKCIQACPVDAIIGAPKLMHGIIADRCTGCALCIPPCPVDCITLASSQHE